MKKTILLFFSLCITVMLQAVNPTTLSVVSTAGGLSTAITTAGGNPSTVTSLTITGTIDARDFLVMRDNLPALSVINLSAVTIAAYTGTQGTQGSDNNYVYAANAIPIEAFYNANTGVNDTILTSITLPASVTFIGGGAFANCYSLTSLTLPASVTSIGINAFTNSNALITVDANNPNFSSANGVLFNKNKTELIQFPTSITGSYVIPSSVNFIEPYAFAVSVLTSVTIPASVTSIGTAAFELCLGLTSIYANPTTPVNLALSDSVFSYVNTSSCTLYVPTNSVSSYQAANQWQDFNIVGTATAVQQIKDNVSIFPNPVVDNFNISGLTAPQTLQLFDLNGKLILSQQVDNGTVPASFLKTGIYILKIGSFETKLIKQ
jgi:hypothetical protein